MSEKNDNATNIADLVSPKNAALAIRPESLTVKKRLTLDATSIARLGQVIAQMDSELYNIELAAPGGKGEKRPATCVDITNVVTGEQFCLICNAVLAGALSRALMTGELTGRYFAIQSGDIVAGKHYRRVEVAELTRAE